MERTTIDLRVRKLIPNVDGLAEPCAERTESKYRAASLEPFGVQYFTLMKKVLQRKGKRKGKRLKLNCNSYGLP